MRNHSRNLILPRAPKPTDRRQTLAQIVKDPRFSKTSFEASGSKWPQFWQSDDWYLLHDNSPAYRSQLVKELFAKTRINVLPCSPYSPDVTPCDICLLPS
ncbi:hypothetical protein TNCV_1567121 [Trichonephila clavipes]|nr:hypothetical protein TNCV_1567121 [Trichonephila clavipes]